MAAFSLTPINILGALRESSERERKRLFGGFVSDPSKLTPTPATRPTYQIDFKSLPGGATQIRRQTTEQANRPPIGTPYRTATGEIKRTGSQPKMFQMATLQRGLDPAGPQFPFELRRGISSDASRQFAFQTGLSSGEGRVGFAKKALGATFDPRFMFDPNFQRFMLQQQLQRRQDGF